MVAKALVGGELLWRKEFAGFEVSREVHPAQFGAQHSDALGLRAKLNFRPPRGEHLLESNLGVQDFLSLPECSLLHFRKQFFHGGFLLRRELKLVLQFEHVLGARITVVVGHQGHAEAFSASDGSALLLEKSVMGGFR